MNAASAHGRMASLDLLRLLAALLVVAFHFLFRGAAADGYLAVAFPEAVPYALGGYLGVNLFFLISGFVIAWSAEGRDAFTFAIARFVRLWPGYVICMSATAAVMAFAAHPALPVSLSQYLANLTMFAPGLRQPFMDGAYWSIVLEIIFYGWVAAAVAARLFDTRSLELVAGWLLIAATNEFLLHSGTLRLLFITEYAGFFAGGVLAYDLMKRGPRAEALVLFLAAFLLSTASLFSGRAWMLAHYGTALTPTVLVACSVAVYATFLATLRLRLPTTRVIMLIGALTYPLYLLHQHIGYVLIGALEPLAGRWTAAILALGIVLAGAIVIVVALERPAQAWLKPRLTNAAGFLLGLARLRRPDLGHA
jgi:peptidoglycan/LPS O-acetylase OafA/YrhL